MRPSLPPMPDAAGRPRPPAAPVVAAHFGPLPAVTVTHHGPTAGRSSPLVGGDSTAPLLESVAETRRPTAGRVLGIPSGVLVVPFGALAVYLWWSGAGTAAVIVTAAVAAVLLGWLAVAVLLSSGGETAEVGARSIASRGPNDEIAGPVVDLYLLEAVAVRETAGGPVLELRQRLSALGRSVGVSIPCGVLEGSAEAWALVHLGIRHSEAAGAEIDARTRQLLGLPAAPPTPTSTDHEGGLGGHDS